ncbi:MAG: hypothetical protein ACWA6X_02235 [Bauldia sp.]|jgi:hypothetical protein
MGNRFNRAFGAGALLLVLGTETNARDVTYHFEDFPRINYCTLTDMSVQLLSPPHGSNRAILRFNQDCGSSRSDQSYIGPWTFDVKLLTASGAFIRTVSFSYSHRCGYRFVELTADAGPTSPVYVDPIGATASTSVTWHHYDRVHGC